MGTVASRLADAARRAGASLDTGAAVRRIVHRGGVVEGVELSNGTEVRARVVLVNADPFRMRDLVGREQLPDEYNSRLDDYARDGTTLKVNLALDGLPEFTCLKENKGQHHTTIHILPQHDVIASLGTAFSDARAGKLPDFPAVEWYTHTTVDPSLRDPGGHHNAALFVQWVPYSIAESTWAAEEERYVDHLLSLCDRFAPGTSARVVDRFVLHPQRIESHFGMTRGHIHHVDNSFGFADRLPYATPIAGLYSASAGCHPAGSVIGAAGHNAARQIQRDLNVRRTPS
jgi:phytoene dehydrogenase-like protein